MGLCSEAERSRGGSVGPLPGVRAPERVSKAPPLRHRKGADVCQQHLLPWDTLSPTGSCPSILRENVEQRKRYTNVHYWRTSHWQAVCLSERRGRQCPEGSLRLLEASRSLDSFLLFSFLERPPIDAICISVISHRWKHSNQISKPSEYLVHLFITISVASFRPRGLDAVSPTTTATFHVAPEGPSSVETDSQGNRPLPSWPAEVVHPSTEHTGLVRLQNLS